MRGRGGRIGTESVSHILGKDRRLGAKSGTLAHLHATQLEAGKAQKADAEQNHGYQYLNQRQASGVAAHRRVQVFGLAVRTI